LLDLHLSGVLAKRLRGVTRLPIEFQRNGKPDDVINAQLHSPWFKELRKDIIMSEFWGFTLVQFYLDEEGNIRYDLIDRKHYDPVRRVLLKFQDDQDGISIDNFSNCLFVGSERGLGIFAELMPAILYKRGDMADWAQFCNVFGMPIREYTYDAGDEAARRRLIADARRQGSNAVYIHPKDSDLTLVESGNKTGSSDLYKTFADYWDSKISIRVLGNTLTTDAKETGTQSLGTVHKEEEEDMNADDRDFILDVLNYHMRPIFANLGFNVEGGEFVYAKKDKINPSQHIDIITKLNGMGLPMDDDWLYETFGVEKPKDYDKKKAEIEAQKEALRQSLTESQPQNGASDEHLNSDKKAFKSRLSRFFGIAPATGADTDF
jgi:phage gp29-like protein